MWGGAALDPEWGPRRAGAAMRRLHGGRLTTRAGPLRLGPAPGAARAALPAPGGMRHDERRSAAQALLGAGLSAGADGARWADAVLALGRQVHAPRAALTAELAAALADALAAAPGLAPGSDEPAWRHALGLAALLLRQVSPPPALAPATGAGAPAGGVAGLHERLLAPALEHASAGVRCGAPAPPGSLHGAGHAARGGRGDGRCGR